MTDDTDRVLASIDDAIDGYVTWDGDSDDALNWEANPAEPFDEAAWLQDGYVDDEGVDGDAQVVTICAEISGFSDEWPNNWTTSPDPEAVGRAFAAINRALQPQFEAMKSAVVSIGKAFKLIVDANHPQFALMTYGDDYRWHYRSCRLCNPAGNPKPLKVDGAEYRRRRNRRRRG